MKIILHSLAIVFLLRLSVPIWAADAVALQFFEEKIRPVLVEHCYSCHSVAASDSKKLQGGLFLDSAAGIEAGGESGPVLVKGKANESVLLAAMKYDGMEMPPAGKLADEIIADFEKWIAMGAPDPREGELPIKPKREIDVASGKEWWSFQSLRAVAVPDESRPIDSFILRELERHGLQLNPPTTKEKWIRRVYFDLIGLPPTPNQVKSFVEDDSEMAFERIVDTLLASPAYGERWGRHWLDTARFAESGGYEFDGFRPGAYHYRDWVIRALNRDLPFDEFVRMQIAGDIIAPKDLDGASATGFLVAGPYPGQITAKTVERIRYDQIDDMMMTIGGSMLGITLGCVRCHEHKYDPIPHQDYYALAASLAKTVHGPRSMDVDPAATLRARRKHQAAHKPFVEALESFASSELPKRFASWKKTELKKLPETVRWQILEPVKIEALRSYFQELPGFLIAHNAFVNPSGNVRERGRQARLNNDELCRLTFQSHQKNVQALRLDMFTDKSLPQRGPGLNADGSFQLSELNVTVQSLNPDLKEPPQKLKLKPVFAAFEDAKQPLSNALDGKANTSWIIKENAKKDNAAIFEFDPPLAGFEGGSEITVELKFRELGVGRMRVSISVEPNPATWAGESAPQHANELKAMAASSEKELPEYQRIPLARWFATQDSSTAKVFEAVKKHAAAAPRPKLTEVYTTVAGGEDLYFLRRGEVDNKQGKAEPGFLKVLCRGDTSADEVSETVDPRLALAQWMTDIEHGAGPLLARVIVNRLWQHHFGEGIVGTPNHFGAQGDPPTHPELLEFLANELVRNGWKLKPMHRLMVMSQVYRQSNDVDPARQKIDPGNRYLWHFRPRRLEAETIRDALLAIGGNLDDKMFGPSVMDSTLRRSVYLRVKRSELLPVMTMFDAPEPTQSIGERMVTTVPTQALAMMNSPFVRQQAEKLASQIRPDVDGDISDAIERGYKIVLGRSPTSDESTRMVAFITSQSTESENATNLAGQGLVEFCHVLLCLNEFIYVD